MKLTKDEKKNFVDDLWDYATPIVRKEVEAEYMEKTGFSMSTLRDRRNGYSNYREIELDILMMSFEAIMGPLYFQRFHHCFGADARAIRGEAAFQQTQREPYQPKTEAGKRLRAKMKVFNQ